MSAVLRLDITHTHTHTHTHQYLSETIQPLFVLTEWFLCCVTSRPDGRCCNQQRSFSWYIDTEDDLLQNSSQEGVYWHRYVNYSFSTHWNSNIWCSNLSYSNHWNSNIWCSNFSYNTHWNSNIWCSNYSYSNYCLKVIFPSITISVKRTFTVHIYPGSMWDILSLNGSLFPVYSGFGLEALCFIILGFITTGTPAVVLLTLGIGVSGMTISGWQINHLDLAPRYVFTPRLVHQYGIWPVLLGYNLNLGNKGIRSWIHYIVCVLCIT